MQTTTFVTLIKRHLFFGICCMLSVMWLSFVLYLDLQYDKFPAVSLGGVKILLAGYVVVGLSYLLWQGVVIAWKRARATVKVR
jgi:hypothetical protein